MKKTITARELALIGIFTAVTAALSPFAVPLPFSPVPITFGVVAVYLSGILLKPKHAVLTQICYLLVGAVGMPVFSGFRGGVPALFGPTGGYLLVYPLMAWLVSVTLNSRKSRTAEIIQNKAWLLLKSGASITAAHLLLYSGGTAWMCATTGSALEAVLAAAVYPFIPLDIVKIIFCVAVIVPLRSRFLSMKLLMLGDAPKTA